jgi:ubiquitin carboxyl-terminal hydrolase 10
MREYPVIDSAESVEKLRLRLKENELEQYGEPFTPDFVYNVINRLPRFSTMRVCISTEPPGTRC